MSIRVLIADDQSMVRAGFRMILESQGDIEVVGEAENGEQATAAARRMRPDVVLMDIQMPVVDGLKATAQIMRDRRPGQPRRHPHDLRARRVRLRRPEGGRQRLSAEERVARAARPRRPRRRGRRGLLAPSVTRRIIEQFATRPVRPELGAQLESLTQRELEVLTLMSRGNSNAELAAQLFVSEGTIKTHVSSLLGKLGLRDRVQAVVLAYESGLITPGA